MVTIGKREYTTARAEANRRYNEKAYAQIAVQIPKDTARLFKAKCERDNISQRQAILTAIEKFLGE